MLAFSVYPKAPKPVSHYEHEETIFLLIPSRTAIPSFTFSCYCCAQTQNVNKAYWSWFFFPRGSFSPCCSFIRLFTDQQLHWPTFTYLPTPSQVLWEISYKTNWGFIEFPCSQARPANYENPGRRDPWKQNDPSLNAPLVAAAVTFALKQCSSSNKSWLYLWSHSPETRMHCYVSWLDLLRRESRILSQLQAGMFQGDMADRVWSRQENIHLASTDLEEEEHTCFNLYITGKGMLASLHGTRNPSGETALLFIWQVGTRVSELNASNG